VSCLRLIRSICVYALLVGSALTATADSRPSWASLTPAQQQALTPLQRDWPSIDANRKQKWLEVAARFPSLPADERLRVQERMAAWARLTPAERADARLQYQQVRQLPAQERQARWQAYQALPEDERLRLARGARPAAKPASAADALARARAQPEPGTGKRNLVVTSSLPPSRPVAPTVVQAKPGATTTTMSMRAPPPSHNQPGLPKIAATPGFVDPATLLPRRGPQGAAVRAAVAVDAEAEPP
jgi:hypothetical protein